jgi:putative protein-disulfide isomerase
MTTRLIYIADPMCSWCYGFGPELSGLLDAVPDMELEIVVGGLRAYNTQQMDDRLKATLLSHWRHVEQASGLPFSDAAISRAGFVYDTEPACRAVVAARLLAPAVPPPALLDVFHAIQRAFYAEGVDVTRGEALAEIASAVLTKHGFPIDAASFHAKWSEQASIAATRNDFIRTQRWGISGFPTVLIEQGKELMLVVSGYAKAAALLQRVQALTGQNA